MRNFSSFKYIIIISSLILSVSNIYYMNSDNIPYIIGVVILVFVPCIVLARFLYTNNITMMATDIPKVVYHLIKLLLVLIMVSLVTNFVFVSSWLLTSNEVVIENLTAIGLIVVSMLLYMIILRLELTKKQIYHLAQVLATVNFIILPVLGITILASLYTQLLSVTEIGHLVLSPYASIRLFAGIQILFLIRLSKEEEEKVSRGLWPMLALIVIFYALAFIVVNSTTSHHVEGGALTYGYRYIESLSVSHLFNINTSGIIAMTSVYNSLDYMFMMIFVTIVLKQINELHFARIKTNQYLSPEQMRERFMSNNRRNMTIGFVVAMVAIYAIAGGIGSYQTLASELSRIAQLLLNVIVVLLILRILLRVKETPIVYKLMASLLLIFNVAIFFFIGN